MHNENKFQLLCELTTGQDPDNKMMQGEERPHGPKRMTLQDIMNYHEKRTDDKSNAPDILPSPLTNNHISILADMYSNAVSLKSDIKKAMDNPVMDETPKLEKAASAMHKKLEHVCKLITSMGEDLDSFSIAK
jgi:hypothetical protein